MKANFHFKGFACSCSTPNCSFALVVHVLHQSDVLLWHPLVSHAPTIFLTSIIHLLWSNIFASSIFHGDVICEAFLVVGHGLCHFCSDPHVVICCWFIQRIYEFCTINFFNCLPISSLMPSAERGSVIDLVPIMAEPMCIAQCFQ